MMKKISLLLCMVLCFCLSGCGNNAFAEREYNSNEKIAEEADKYAMSFCKFESMEESLSYVVEKFDGRETIWTENRDDDVECEMDISFTLSKGQAKVVHVDADGNVTTVIECTPETITDGFVTKTVALMKGENRLKIVGYNCKELNLEVIFRE